MLPGVEATRERARGLEQAHVHRRRGFGQTLDQTGRLCRMALTRRHWLALIGIEVVLFVLSGVTSKNSSHPGAASNILWTLFLVGIVVLIVLAIAALVRSRRSRAT